MANKTILKAWIDSERLLDLMKQLNVSIRELSRRERIGYSERQLRWMLKTRQMSLNTIMAICSELKLGFGTRPTSSGTPFVIFFLHDPEGVKEWTDFKPAGYTLWTPILDPSGFEYPSPIAR